MAKNKYAGAMEYQAKIQKKLDFGKIKIQCKCYHHGADSMNMSLVRIKQDPNATNKLMFKCTNCWKQINFKAIPKELRLSSINVIDTMLDLIKMKLDPRKPEEEKLINSLADFQFRLLTGLEDLFCSVVLGIGKKGKKNKKNNSEEKNSSVHWGKPTYGGR